MLSIVKGVICTDFLPPASAPDQVRLSVKEKEAQSCCRTAEIQCKLLKLPVTNSNDSGECQVLQ